MDRADLRHKMVDTFEDIIGRTWVVPAETRRLARAAKECTEERDDWVDTLLTYVNKTREPEQATEEPELPGHKPTTSRVATEVAGALKAIGYNLSPTIILAILGIIVSLYQACRPKLTPAQACKRAANPRFLDRVAMRRAIREHLGDYRNPQDSEAVEAALLDAGQVVTVQDMTAMYKENQKEQS